MNILILPILANTQLKTSSIHSIFRMCHIALQSRLFRLAKRAVLGSETRCFCKPSDASHNLLHIRLLTQAAIIVAFNIKC